MTTGDAAVLRQTRPFQPDTRRNDHAAILPARADPPLIKTPVVADAEQIPWLQAGFGNRVRTLASADQTGGALTVMEFDEAQGYVTVLHRHDDADEMIYVLEGTLTLFMGGEHQQVGAGSYVLIPKGMAHAQGNTSGKRLRFLLQLSPSGFERFFFGRQALEDKHGVNTPDYLREIEALAAQCHLSILGPPPEA